MSDVTSIAIPRNTVNDDRVLILEWKVADGQTVVTGQVLAEVETSKSTIEISSPIDGIVGLNAGANQEVGIEHILCFVGPTETEVCEYRSRHLQRKEPETNLKSAIPSDADSTPRMAIEVDPRVELPSTSNQRVHFPSTRFSDRAKAALKEMGISESDVSATGLIRACDIIDEVRGQPAGREQKYVPAPHEVSRTGPSAEPAFQSAQGVSYRTEPLRRSKQIEARLLTWSTQQAIKSSVVVMVPTAGQEHLIRRDVNFVERARAHLIQAASLLLKEFYYLNACCLNAKEVRLYNCVHVGYAIDAGDGLKVPILRNADQLDCDQIAWQLQRFVDQYLGKSLQPADLVGGTFTITDLSGSGVTRFDPLIPEGQSAILGIGAEYPIGDSRRAYDLILSFDHRLAEGRQAAAFLNQLKDRLIAFERALPTTISQSRPGREIACHRCGMTLLEATSRNHFLVNVEGPQAERLPICTICLQGR